MPETASTSPGLAAQPEPVLGDHPGIDELIGAVVHDGRTLGEQRVQRHPADRRACAHLLRGACRSCASSLRLGLDSAYNQP